jgi:hypothetical protein
LQHSLSQIYIRGFQLVTRYTNIIWSMDFEWIKGVICSSKQTWEGWLSLRWFWTTNWAHKQGAGWATYLVHSCLLCCFVTACSTGLHLPNVLVHPFACIIAPSTWCFRFESPPCSLVLHASMIFLQNQALATPHACSLHVVW